MAHTFALKRLLDIAETTADEAAASLGTLNWQLQQQEEKLLLLFKYRDDYQERLRQSANVGLDGAALRNFHSFLERLEQAILQQHTLVVTARTRAECGRTDWQLKQRKSMAFDTLSQRFDATSRHHESRREQKLQDDFANRSSSAKQRGFGLESVTATKIRR